MPTQKPILGTLGTLGSCLVPLGASLELPSPPEGPPETPVEFPVVLIRTKRLLESLPLGRCPWL